MKTHNKIIAGLALVAFLNSCGSKAYPGSAPMSQRYVKHSAGMTSQEKYEAATQRHVELQDSRFATVKAQPVSTFSVDVDSASYTYCRRLLEQGQLPAADAIRVEEFINYFNYDYAAPASGVALNTSLSNCPWDARTKLVRVSLKAAQAQGVQPAHIVLLVDTSGSMGGSSRIELAKTSLLNLVDRLGSEYSISLLTYSNEVTEHAVAVSCDAQGKADLRRCISSLSASGSTNGADALRRAYKLARDKRRANQTSRVLIATDGDFNVGMSSDEAMLNLIREEARRDIFLSVLGVGQGNLNDSMMEKISNQGNGTYFYLDNEDEAERTAEKLASGSLHAAAVDARLQIEFNSEFVRSWRLVGYSDRKMNEQDFLNENTDAGDIAQGEEVTALYEISLHEQLPSPRRNRRYASNQRRSDLAPSSIPALRSDISSPRVSSGEMLIARLAYRPKPNATLIEQQSVLPANSTCLEIERSDAQLRLAIAATAFAEYLRGRGESCFQAAEVQRTIDALPVCRGRDELQNLLTLARKIRN